MTDLLGKTYTNPVIGDEVTFVHTAAETGGERTVMDFRLRPGGGNVLHSHGSYAETFEVTEGTLMVQLGKDTVCLKAGDTITAPPDADHRFYATEDEPVRFTITMTPAHAGFETSLAIAYGLARDGEARAGGIPKSLRNISILFTLAESHLPGIFALLEAPFRWIAGTTRSQRVKADLIARYCR